MLHRYIFIDYYKFPQCQSLNGDIDYKTTKKEDKTNFKPPVLELDFWVDNYAVYQWCESKSRRGRIKKLSDQISNSNTVGLNFQTYKIYSI